MHANFKAKFKNKKDAESAIRFLKENYPIEDITIVTKDNVRDFISKTKKKDNTLSTIIATGSGIIIGSVTGYIISVTSYEYLLNHTNYLSEGPNIVFSILFIILGAIVGLLVGLALMVIYREDFPAISEDDVNTEETLTVFNTGDENKEQLRKTLRRFHAENIQWT